MKETKSSTNSNWKDNKRNQAKSLLHFLAQNKNKK